MEQFTKTPIVKGLEKAYTRARNGIFMMDGKGFLALDCAKYLDSVIDENVPNMNILEGLTPERIADLFKSLNAPAGGETGNSKFFTDSARNFIFIAAVFQEAMVAQGLAKNNLSTLLQIVTQLALKPKEGEQHNLIALIKGHEDFGVEATLLTDAALSFADIQNNDGETLKNIMTSVTAWFAPFFQNKALRKWCDSETSDIDVTKILWGQRIGVCLPEATFPTAGAMVCKFLKAKLFKAIQMRGDRWEKAGMSKVFFIADEVQRIVDQSDLAMLPIARSLGLSCVFATQNIDSYYAELTKEKTLAMIDSFASIISFKSSEQTYEYIQGRIGKDRVWVEQIQTGMISYGLSNKLNMASPMFDPNNQYRGWMKHFSMGAIKKFFKRSTVGTLQGEGKAGLGERYATMQLSDQPIHILQEKDIQIVMTKKFHAIAMLSRGGAPRRDIIQTNPLDVNFEPIKITYEDKLAAAKARFGGKA